MSVPDFQTIMLPLLRLAADDQEHSLHKAIETLADHFSLSEADRKELLPSGQESRFDNRVGWARTYLVKAGLLESPKRSYFRITNRGHEVLARNPQKIGMKDLEQFPEYVKFKTKVNKPETATPETDSSGPKASVQTPEEALENNYQRLRDALAQELLATVKKSSPAFFERLVVDLLVRMGYGGSRKEAGKAVGKSGDGGIDGIINEDKLGLDTIYIQAKKWENVVSSPEIQKFAGALMGQKARKGVFITTSSFTADARKFVAGIESKIVLIDGEELAQMMIDNGVGVASYRTYELRRIDSDYFAETLIG